MKRLSTPMILALSALATAACVSFFLPGRTSTLGPKTTYARNASDVVRLSGIVRDFRSSNTDFDASAGEASGHIAGLVDVELGPDGLPIYDGAGNVVNTQAKDATGNNIAPVLANAALTKAVDFTISGGKVVPSESFAAKLTVLGAAMQNASLEINVTTRMKVGSTTVEPFGAYASATGGNVHDNNNPRHHVMSSSIAGGTALSVTGRSYYKSGGSWTTLQTVDSSTNSTWVKVLRDGDAVPNITPFGSQSTIQSFLVGYIDPVSKTVTIADNQAIFLFELATTDPSSEYVDYQDLVVLLTMAKGPEAFVPGPIVPACGPVTDTEATLNNTAHNGAISSADTFKQWFSDSMGTNLSTTSGIDLIRQNDSTYLFDDTTDPYYNKLGGFYPADGRMYGDKDSSGHNENFTFSFDAKFVYNSSLQQFFSTYTDTEVWVFIDGKLALDMGGLHSAMPQRIDLSRLCLEDGKEYELSFFLANRYAPQSSLRIHTNINFVGAVPTPRVSAAHD